MRNILILLVFLFAFLEVFGQRTLLMLQKNNQHKNAYYEVGDELSFYVEGRKSMIQDRIIGFEDSTVMFWGYQVPVGQITALHIDDKTRWWLRFKLSQLSLIGGAGYLLISAVNGQKLNKDTWVVGGSLIGLGVIFRLLIPHKIKIRGSTKLRILTV